MFKKIKNQRGFTLIEVLLVVAIISILAGIIILAINPNKQLGDTRNATRRADMQTIINAVYQYSLDNNGNLPSSIRTTPTDICATNSSDCTGLVQLNVLTDNGKYLVAIPADPSTGTATDTHYQVSKDGNNRVTVDAPDAEQGADISVTR